MEHPVERRSTRRSPDEEFTLEALMLLQSCGASIRESDRAAIDRARAEGQGRQGDVRQGGDRRSGDRRSGPGGSDDLSR